MIGNVSVTLCISKRRQPLPGSAIWLSIATFFRVPVSTTHSVVGATVGFALVVNGSKGIDWIGLAKIGEWYFSFVWLDCLIRGRGQRERASERERGRHTQRERERERRG